MHRLRGPDALAGSGVASAPPLGERGDQLQSPAALVGLGRVADPGHGQTAVGDLADQIGVEQQPQLQRSPPMSYDVPDQLADEQFRGRRHVVQPPRGQLLPDVPAGQARRLGVLREWPGGHPVRAERVHTGDQEGGVVVGVLPGGEQAGDEVFAEPVQVFALPGAQELRQLGHALVDLALGRFDEAVGVQHEKASRGHRQFHRLERWLRHPQRRIGDRMREVDGAVGMDHGRWRVSGAGDGARPGGGVVQRVQARGVRVLPEAADDVVEVAHDLVGWQFEVGEGVNGRAQSSHRGSLGEAVAHHVADDERDPSGGERYDVVPVAADVHAVSGGQVAGGGGARR